MYYHKSQYIEHAIGSQHQSHCLVLYRYYTVSLLHEILEVEESLRPEMCALQQWEEEKGLEQLSIVIL
jgi:hypothetical protein